MSEWMDAEAHADRALELYERGRWAEAETELRKALALNPDQAEWHYNLGLTLEAAGRDVEALSCYERTIELLPDQAEPLVAAGMVCNRLERHEAALQWLDQALAYSSSCESAYAERIDALTRLGRHEEAETTFFVAQEMLEEASPRCLAAIAESLIERGAYPRAGWCLREALRLEPQMPRLRARLAEVLAATGRPHQAVQLYLRELREDPGNIDTLLDFGELLADLGRVDEASEKFRRALELEPANVDAHEQLGRLAMSAGLFDRAAAEFELVLRLDPEVSGIRLSLAEALWRAGQFDQAVHHLQLELEMLQRGDEAASIGDDSPGRMERLGAMLLEIDAPADAVRVLNRIGTPSLTVMRMHALAYFRSGDVNKGGMLARRILRRDPRCVASMYNLALAALNEKRYPVAAGWIARGLRVDRHDAGLRRLRVRLWLARIASMFRCVPGRIGVRRRGTSAS